VSGFAANLANLPPVDSLRGIELHGPDGEREEIINQPGSQGSLRVYAFLLGKHGALTRAAACEGLDLFAEHTPDAQANPGRHPNIDRLLTIAADGRAWAGECVIQVRDTRA
jgi:hypothetical protein